VTLAIAADWYERRDMGGGITMLTEPHAHAYIRANIWHARSRHGSGNRHRHGAAAAAAELDIVPGKPLLAIATHIHVDHVGSLHEFAEMAGRARRRPGSR
jgi:glyoxylase-like metal-dependent hydrolase (beta-lactamase superfamily II)